MPGKSASVRKRRSRLHSRIGLSAICDLIRTGYDARKGDEFMPSRRKDRPRGKTEGRSEMRATNKALGVAALCFGSAVAMVFPAHAWEPTHPIEIIVPAGTGGGADQMARVTQGIITKHNLSKQSVVVINQSRSEEHTSE